ncbi:glycerophosphoryl diester phosphodiesterase [Opitutaceae bacterium TAV1]|nr:glycerophosphoryl diester phosphodiesterase [Opitutaceae bacterium TAV1]
MKTTMSTQSSTLVFAHRGASHDAPENTLAAYAVGWEQQADGLELDIHLTADGQIVVMHDADTKRTTSVAGKISAQTFEELRKLDVGAWKGATWTGQRIPTLDEALASVPAGKQVIIEIKCDSEIIPALKDFIEKSGKPADELLIHCFTFETICAARQAIPHVRACWLVNPDRDTDLLPLLEKARAAGLDALNPDVNSRIDEALVTRAHANNMGIFVWTVNDPDAARRLKSLGVDGILTDRPGWMRVQLLK